MTKLQMHDDRVLIMLVEVKKNMIETFDDKGNSKGKVEATDKGIVIPESAKGEAPFAEGIIHNVGRNVTTMQEGDRVIIQNGTGIKVPFNGEEYLILRESDVLALVETATSK